jgi:hypothetical protein
MATQTNDSSLTDTELISSRMVRVDPDNVQSQSAIDDEDGLEEDMADDEPNEDLYNEPVDEYGDPTDVSDQGEPDHHQDDNYALGGHVTRSSS